MRLEYMAASRVSALQAIAPQVSNPPGKGGAKAKRTATAGERDPWYVRGLRPIENQIDVFLKDDFVWLGY